MTNKKTKQSNREKIKRCLAVIDQLKPSGLSTLKFAKTQGHTYGTNSTASDATARPGRLNAASSSFSRLGKSMRTARESDCRKRMESLLKSATGLFSIPHAEHCTWQILLANALGCPSSNGLRQMG
jgi:hypothetical protein